MAQGLPRYLIGKNVALFAVAPATATAAGVITKGTELSIKTLKVFDSAQYEANPGLVEIHPADGGITNNLVGVEDFTITITEIISGDGFSNLKQIYGTSDYFYVHWKDTPDGASGTTGYNFAAYGVRGSLSESRVEGKNVVQMTMKPSGIFPFWGTGTPSFS